MTLEIGEREREGVAILDLSGRLTVGEAAGELRSHVQRLAEAGKTKVVLNLQDVDYIDSTGLGAMVICFTSLRKAGGRMCLVNLSRRNIELLVLTKLETVFDSYNDEQDAVNSFFPDREIKRFDILAFLQNQTDESR